MSKPEISVIIPTYNRRQQLRYSLTSILEQDFHDFEILVVDDASSDDTNTLCSEMADSRIRYIRLPNRVGAQSARTKGIALSQAELICFLDSDDILLPQSLSYRHQYFKRNPECECSYSNYEVAFSRHTDILIKKVDLGHIPQHSLYPYVLNSLKLAPMIVVMVKKASLLEIGGLDCALPGSHDDDLYIRFAKRGKCHHIPVFASRIVHYEGESITKLPRNMAVGKKMLIEKHKADVLNVLGPKILQAHHIANAYDFLLARDFTALRECFDRARALGPLPFSLALFIFGKKCLISSLRLFRKAIHAVMAHLHRPEQSGC